MGCGRVGAALASNLSQIGHSVAVIDQNPDAFRRLPEDFSGQNVTGLVLIGKLSSKPVLRTLTVSPLSPRATTPTSLPPRTRDFMTNVVTRIYDPTRAEVYERLGIATVPTVKWTADQVLRHLIPLVRTTSSPTKWPG